jgi:hypothetical protein
MLFVKRLTLLVCCVSLAGMAQAQQVIRFGKGRIGFRSDAPQEVIKASSEALTGIIDPSRNTFLFKVPVSSFNGFNSALQKVHFNENYMESIKFPEAVFSGKIVETIDYAVDGTYEVRAKGKLKVHGIEFDRIIKAQLSVKKDKVKITSAFSVLLSDHNIPIPKVVNEKLANEILVTMETQGIITSK